MDDGKKGFQSIDAYIATFPEATQQVLQQIRATIHAAAPDATEKISYQMPTFYLKGNVVHFAAWKSHIGFYPAPTGLEEFKDALAPYPMSKGSVQFPLDQPMPLDLIARIVKFRVEENLKKVAQKSGKKKQG